MSLPQSIEIAKFWLLPALLPWLLHDPLSPFPKDEDDPEVSVASQMMGQVSPPLMTIGDVSPPPMTIGESNVSSSQSNPFP